MPAKTDVQALLFDVFGTVVDWRSSLIDDRCSRKRSRRSVRDDAALLPLHAHRVGSDCSLAAEFGPSHAGTQAGYCGLG